MAYPPRASRGEFTFFGNASDSPIDAPSALPMTASEIPIGKWPCQIWFRQAILSPTKIRTTARPYRRRWKRPTAPASKKYMDRSPRIAKTFEVKTIKGSRVIAKIAGTESIAKMISVISINASVTRRGVANSFP